MGTKLYELLDEHFHKLRRDDSKCVVEIGSERGQGMVCYRGLEFAGVHPLTD